MTASREQLLREQFEAWAKKQRLSLAYGDCGYVFSSTDMAWIAWQASRAALVVELPPVSDVESDDTDAGYNICHRSVQKKLTEQGLAFHVQGSERWSTVKGEGDGKA